MPMTYDLKLQSAKGTTPFPPLDFNFNNYLQSIIFIDKSTRGNRENKTNNK